MTRHRSGPNGLSKFYALAFVTTSILVPFSGCQGTGTQVKLPGNPVPAVPLASSPSGTLVYSTDCPIVFESDSVARFKVDSAAILNGLSLDVAGNPVTCAATRDGTPVQVTGYTAVEITPAAHVNGPARVEGTKVVLPVDVVAVSQEIKAIIATKIGRNFENLGLDSIVHVKLPKFDLASIDGLPALEAELRQNVTNGKVQFQILVEFTKQWQKDIASFVDHFSAGSIPILLFQTPKNWNELGTLLGLKSFDQFHAHLDLLKQIAATDTLKQLWKRAERLGKDDLEREKARIVGFAANWLATLKVPGDQAREAIREIFDAVQKAWNPGTSWTPLTPEGVVAILDQLKLLSILDPSGTYQSYLNLYEKLSALGKLSSTERLKAAIAMIHEKLLTADQQALAIKIASRLVNELGVHDDLAVEEGSVLAVKLGLNEEKLKRYIDVALWIKGLKGLTFPQVVVLAHAEKLLLHYGITPEKFEQLKNLYLTIVKSKKPDEALLAAIAQLFI